MGKDKVKSYLINEKKEIKKRYKKYNIYLASGLYIDRNLDEYTAEINEDIKIYYFINKILKLLGFDDK